MKTVPHSRSLFFAVVFALIALILTASAQKVPTALSKKVEISPTNVERFRQLAAEYPSAATPEKRNQLIFLAVAEIDVNFRHYQRKRRIGKDLFHVVMDILEIGASTAVSITNGARAKSVIGDSLALVQGARASADKNLRLLEMQILFNKMIERRATVMNQILTNTSLSLEQYPFERAYVDIVSYYNAGTWDTALSMLATDTGASAQAAENLLAAKRAVGIDIPPSAAELRTGATNRETTIAYFTEYRGLQSSLVATPTPSEDAKKVILDKQQALLAKMRSIVGLIISDPMLRPILNDVPTRTGITPAESSALAQSLLKVKDLSLEPKVEDYERVLTAFTSHVIEMSARDSTMIKRFELILEALK